jgi:hypothetical protein
VALSLAWYIVLRVQIPGFDPRVNGKFLARTGNSLDALAKNSGVRPLMDFFSAAPDELAAFLNAEGVSSEDAPSQLPPEKWFSATEGLKTVNALKEAVAEHQIEGASKIMDDLTEFENVLKVASAHGIDWHLAIDF